MTSAPHSTGAYATKTPVSLTPNACFRLLLLVPASKSSVHTKTAHMARRIETPNCKAAVAEPKLFLANATQPRLLHVLPVLTSTPALRSPSKGKLRLWGAKRDRSAERAARDISNILLGSVAQDAGAKKRELNVPSIDLKRLKSKLVQPKLARSIITQLKSLRPHAPVTSPDEHPHPVTPRGVCLTCPDDTFLSLKFPASPAYNAFTSILSLSGPGVLLGQLGQSTGAFGALADVTTELIEVSKVHEGILPPPTDKMSVLICQSSVPCSLP